MRFFPTRSTASHQLQVVTILTLLCMQPAPLSAEPKYGPGVSDSEIKLGQTSPYSGPASGFGIHARVETAVIKMINSRGGINGRKINMISLDDAYSPAKTIEQTRKLVESEGVLAIVGTVGTLANIAVAKYLNSKKVPHLLGITGTDKLNDYRSFPWTVNFLANQNVEGRIYARYLLSVKPDAKIAILYENDDFGKGYLEAFKDELGEKSANLVVKEEPYEIMSPTVDSQIALLKASGADVGIFFATPKFAAQAIRRAFEIGWKPLQIVPTPVAQIASVFKPAGLEASTGILTALWRKDINDSQGDNDQDVKDYLAFMHRWAPGEPPEDGSAVFGYLAGVMLEEIIKRCGDDLTRENLMTQTTSIRDLQLPLFLPGIKINISNEDRVPWRSARIGRFDGKGWQYVTEIMTIPDGK
jgi:branched-chain amino acid transport system substrate-binding protein